MENSTSKVLELSDFIGKGRFLNVNNFKEVEQVKKSNLEKAEKNELEKGELGDALGYAFTQNNKFKKKGAEISEKIKALISKVEAKKTQSLSDMEKITKDLDCEPTQPLDEWDRKGLSDAEASMIKTYPWSCCYYNSDNQSANSIVETKAGEIKQKSAASKEEADKCSLYNRIVRTFIECCRDLDKANVFINNVDAKKDYDLSLEELKALGF